MRLRRTRARALTALALIVLPATGVLAAYSLEWKVVAGGGTQHALAGPWRLASTIAQPAPGVSSGGSFSLSAGYWVVAPAQSDLIFQHDFENPTP